jgi:hypothetical protein
LTGEQTLLGGGALKRGGVSIGPNKKANLLRGGALQLLEHAVSLDAARNDDGGGDAEPLAPEVDLLGRLRTLELVDLKRVPVDTANRRGKCCECQRALTERQTLRSLFEAQPMRELAAICEVQD